MLSGSATRRAPPRRAREDDPRRREARRRGEGGAQDVRGTALGDRSSRLARASGRRIGPRPGRAPRRMKRSRRRSRGWRPRSRSLDAELEEHRKDVERLRELSKWRASAKRAQQRADLTSSPEWKGVSRRRSTGRGLSPPNLDALGAMARGRRRNDPPRREAEVNRFARRLRAPDHRHGAAGAGSGPGGGDSASKDSASTCASR